MLALDIPKSKGFLISESTWRQFQWSSKIRDVFSDNNIIIMGQVKINTDSMKNKRKIPEQEWHERDFMIWAFDVSVLYNLSSVGVSVHFCCITIGK